MAKTWRVGIVKDTSKPMLGLHGLHTAFRGLPGVEVGGHVDSNTADLERKLSATGAKRHYATLAEMLAKEPLDIVVLTSRHPADHLEQIRAAAERGCHLYCEKPLTASLREADRIVEIVAQHRVTLCMAHPARYALSFRTMKQMVDAGAIGTPMAVYGRGKCDHRGGGEDLMTLGTHVLDLETFLFGAPECVFADVTTGGRPVAPGETSKTVEPIGPAAGDDLFAYFRFPKDVRGIFQSRRGLARPGVLQMGITVVGTGGSLSMRFDDGGDPPLRISKYAGPLEDDARWEVVPLKEERVIPGAEPLDYSLCGQRDIPRARWFLESNRFAAWDLICAIDEGRQPVSNVHNARLALEMIYGIYAAALARGVAAFPLADRSHPLGE